MIDQSAFSILGTPPASQGLSPCLEACGCVFQILWPLTGPHGLSPLLKIKEPRAEILQKLEEGKTLGRLEPRAVFTPEAAEPCSQREDYFGFITNRLHVGFINADLLDGCGCSWRLIRTLLLAS